MPVLVLILKVFLCMFKELLICLPHHWFGIIELDPFLLHVNNNKNPVGPAIHVNRDEHLVQAEDVLAYMERRRVSVDLRLIMSHHITPPISTSPSLLHTHPLSSSCTF